MSLVTWTLLAGLIAQTGNADPQSQMTDLLTTAVTDAAKAAGDDTQSILLLVHGDPRSPSDLELPTVLGRVRSLVNTAFGPVGRRVLTSTAAEELLLGRAGAIRPVDVARIDDPADFDAVLSVTYSRRNQRRMLRLVLLTKDKSVWHRTLTVPDKLNLGEKPAGAAASAGATAKTPAPSPANQLAKNLAGGAAASAAASGARAGGTSTAGTGGRTGGRAGAGTAAKKAGGGAAPGELGRKVLEFAVNHLNQQVGNGECWTLGAEALLYAGARPARGYNFGRELAQGEQWQPGDILQFTSAKFVEGGFWKLLGTPNHTAVIYAVDGNKVWVLHQNFGTRNVTLLELNFATLTQGTVQAFRPIPPE